MRNGAWFIAIAFVLLTGPFAFADDKSECLDGIKAIKAAVAKNPPKRVLKRLKQALANAEQEEFEGDWDECVAALRQAHLPKENDRLRVTIRGVKVVFAIRGQSDCRKPDTSP